MPGDGLKAASKNGGREGGDYREGIKMSKTSARLTQSPNEKRFGIGRKEDCKRMRMQELRVEVSCEVEVGAVEIQM